MVRFQTFPVLDGLWTHVPNVSGPPESLKTFFFSTDMSVGPCLLAPGSFSLSSLPPRALVCPRLRLLFVVTFVTFSFLPFCSPFSLPHGVRQRPSSGVST